MWLQLGTSVFSILLLTSLTVAGENRLRFQRQSGLTLTQWPSNTINYYFDGLSSSQEAIATRVMLNTIEAATCLNFVESSSATNRIRIYSDPTTNWCESSDYGMKGGEQTISFGIKCLYDGLFAKALLHAFGFYRMEVRSDRDDWVTFSMDDVDPALRDGLAKLDASVSGNPLIYNFGSVVHSSYDMYAYDGTTDYPMMAQLDQYYLSMGAGIITSYDLDMINLYYNCYSGCSNTSSMCQMEGNLNTRTCSECSCPLGFGGVVCETNADEGQTLTATDEWQDLVLSVTGPATLDTPGAYAFDSAVIVTPPGYNFIQFRPTDFTAECPYCTPGCRDFGLEIKYRNHPQRTSPRVCCNEFTGSTFSSRNDRTSIVLYSSTIDVSATIQYRASATNTTVLPALPSYEVQTCQSETCNLFPLPDDVCAVLMIDQSILLPIMDYFIDPIALVQIFITCGNCSDNSSGIEYGMMYTFGCSFVSGAAGFFDGLFGGFFDIFGIGDYISEAGFYVTVFQIAFNTVYLSVQAGVEAVTPEMCPDWVAEDVTTTASP